MCKIRYIVTVFQIVKVDFNGFFKCTQIYLGALPNAETLDSLITPMNTQPSALTGVGRNDYSV